MRILTTEQKDQLDGQVFDGVTRFNPVQDINNNWFVSEEEVEQCTNEEVMWITDLPTAEFIPKLASPTE